MIKAIDVTNKKFNILKQIQLEDQKAKNAQERVKILIFKGFMQNLRHAEHAVVDIRDHTQSYVKALIPDDGETNYLNIDFVEDVFFLHMWRANGDRFECGIDELHTLEINKDNQLILKKSGQIYSQDEISKEQLLQFANDLEMKIDEESRKLQDDQHKTDQLKQLVKKVRKGNENYLLLDDKYFEAYKANPFTENSSYFIIFFDLASSQANQVDIINLKIELEEEYKDEFKIILHDGENLYFEWIRDNGRPKRVPIQI